MGVIIQYIKDALTEGSKIYKLFINYPKCVTDVDKIIKDSEKKLSEISQEFDSLKELASIHASQVTIKIKTLVTKRDRVKGRI